MKEQGRQNDLESMVPPRGAAGTFILALSPFLQLLPVKCLQGRRRALLE